MNIIVLQNENKVIDCLAKQISNLAKIALSEERGFYVGLSGGSVLKYLCTAIPNIETDFSNWKLFFCDERYVDESSEDSTFGAYKFKLIPKTKIKVNQFICIDTKLSLDLCAKDYENKIRKQFNIDKETIPSFDLLLLGMGPDGHTCSLFPDHSLLSEKHRLIAPINDSPKPPPKRVTMTLPLINNARCCIFVMCGSEKAQIAKRIFVDKEPLPAGLVQPKSGNLLCILDKEAGEYLQVTTKILDY